MDDQQNNSSRSGRKPVSKRTPGSSVNSKHKSTIRSKKSTGLLHNNRIRALLFGVGAIIVLLLIVLIATGAFDSAALKQQKAEKNQAVAAQEQTEPVTEEVTEAETTIKETTTQEPEIDLNARTVYFTFDAGPSTNTVDILDVLDENKVKGTFFVETEKGDPDLMKEIVDRGHAIGVYSVSGDTAEIYSSVDNFKNDLNSCRQSIFQATGALTEVYRFPGGSNLAAEQISIEDCREVLSELGMQYYDWNIDSNDDLDATVDAQTIADAIYGNLSVTEFRTNVVLLQDRDSKTTTAEALGMVIPQLKEAGFSFGKLSSKTPEMTFDIE